MWVALFLCFVVAAASGVAALVGPRGIGGFVVSVYVLAVVDVVALVELLSLVHAVNRVTLLVVQAAIALVAAVLVIVLRPAWPDPSGLTEALRATARSRVLMALGSVVGLAWAYQALLALTVPANNWDSLAYHLARVAAWFHHGGVYWIPHAPTDRLNEFQPNAEELILALVAVARDPWPFAVPQFLAGGALVVATGVSSRALGFSRQASAFATLIAATVPMVVLQATTAQNDLVAAALVGCAAALILQGGNRSLIIAGIAIGVAAGVKLTVLLAVPVLVLLALSWGWRALRAFGLAAVVPLLTLGAAGLWRNLQHTGHLLGNGGGRIEHESDGSVGSALVTSYRIGYRLIDLSGLTGYTQLLTVASIVTTGAVYVVLRRRGTATHLALRNGVLCALPLLSPVIFLAAASSMQWVADATNMNVNAPASTSSPFYWGMNTNANEDLSYFGFLGGWLALSCLIVAALGAAGRVPRRIGLLALSIPLYIGLLALHSTYNAWLGRFMLVPLALALPLVAYAWQQPFRIAIAAVAAMTLIGTSIDNHQKTFDSHPWTEGRDRWTAALDPALKGEACIVAVVGPNDPSYLLYGPHLERRVSYADSPRAALGSTAPVVLGSGADPTPLTHAGWRLQPIRPYWTVAHPAPTTPANANSFTCNQ